MRTVIITLLALSIASCKVQVNEKDKYREEIKAAEAAFNDRVKEVGMTRAFLEFGADDAVLNRSDVLYKGKAEIEKYLESSPLKDVELEWSPDHIDVSSSGDMAYTYGPYTFKAKDAEGNTIEAEGIFHTVWKRQADGSWKYVWD